MSGAGFNPRAMSDERKAEAGFSGARRCCEKCNREGQLVAQEAQPGSMGRAIGGWVFRYYLCRWHRAAWNRTRFEWQVRMIVLDYRPDSELLPWNGATRRS